MKGSSCKKTVVIIDPQSTFWISFRRVNHFVQGLNPMTLPDKYSPGQNFVSGEAVGLVGVT